MIKFEDRCLCGTHIPEGYGFYLYGKTLRCAVCGRINTGSKKSQKKRNLSKQYMREAIALVSHNKQKTKGAGE